jgi:O-6-methylguanine DNA methyltransferase
MISYRLLTTSLGILAYLGRNDKLIKIFLPATASHGSFSEIGLSRQREALLAQIKSFKHEENEVLIENESLFEELADDINSYFLGRSKSFRAEYDLSGLTDFTRLVLTANAKIPYGQTLSYGDIAKQIGRPKSFRAVARALAANPIPLVIPCHRVIYSDGSLGGYSGSIGPAFKQFLLLHERFNLD